MIRSINTKINSLYEFIPREIVWKWNWNLFHCNRAILINRFYFVDFTLDFTFFFRNLVELPELSVIIRFTVLSNQTNQFDETNTTFMLTFNT